MTTLVEYIWIDGTRPTPQLRSKTRVVPDGVETLPSTLPRGEFDGSSTNQAPGKDSERLLAPATVIPIRCAATGRAW